MNWHCDRIRAQSCQSEIVHFCVVKVLASASLLQRKSSQSGRFRCSPSGCLDTTRNLSGSDWEDALAGVGVDESDLEVVPTSTLLHEPSQEVASSGFHRYRHGP